MEHKILTVVKVNRSMTSQTTANTKDSLVTNTKLDKNQVTYEGNAKNLQRESASYKTPVKRDITKKRHSDEATIKKYCTQNLWLHSCSTPEKVEGCHDQPINKPENLKVADYSKEEAVTDDTKIPTVDSNSPAVLLSYTDGHDCKSKVAPYCGVETHTAGTAAHFLNIRDDGQGQLQQASHQQDCFVIGSISSTTQFSLKNEVVKGPVSPASTSFSLHNDTPLNEGRQSSNQANRLSNGPNSDLSEGIHSMHKLQMTSEEISGESRGRPLMDHETHSETSSEFSSHFQQMQFKPEDWQESTEGIVAPVFVLPVITVKARLPEEDYCIQRQQVSADRDPGLSKDPAQTGGDASFIPTTVEDYTLSDEDTPEEVEKVTVPATHSKPKPVKPPWLFLLELLENKKFNPEVVRWIDKQNGVFQITNTKRVSEQWSDIKKRPITFVNFARNVRNHKKMVKRIPKTKQHFRFLEPSQWLEYAVDTDAT